MNTEDFSQHDQCQAFHTYSSRYEPLRVSLNYALNESLHAAFVANNPSHAPDKFMSLATTPGIDLDSQGLYTSIIHHSRLVELIATYIIAVEKTEVPSPITCEWGEFQPRSFLLPDGRLRRVILCDRWTAEREKMERFSWRTAADCAVTNRPMVLTAIVIGGIRAGLRTSPWTQGFIHPKNGIPRILKREGEFNDNWRAVYREQTDIKPLEWLKLMQQDGAFEGRVFSVTEDVPKDREAVLEHLSVMAGEMGSTRQTRSSCYRFRPCPYLPACSTYQSPAQLGWVEKTSLIETAGAKLAVIS